MKTIKLNNFEIAGDKLTILAGPCAMESKEISLKTAKKLKEICQKLDINFVFKTSLSITECKNASVTISTLALSLLNSSFNRSAWKTLSFGTKNGLINISPFISLTFILLWFSLAVKGVLGKFCCIKFLKTLLTRLFLSWYNLGDKRK